jgi:hypothetical protein
MGVYERADVPDVGRVVGGKSLGDDNDASPDRGVRVTPKDLTSKKSNAPVDAPDDICSRFNQPSTGRGKQPGVSRRNEERGQGQSKANFSPTPTCGTHKTRREMV